jgi:CAAX prenyl protease-like protein
VEAEAGSPVAAYLVPFLAILAASFVAKSASGAFEWLYPLRFVAAVVVLWYFRAEYRKLSWRIGWQGPVTGLVVFAIWMTPTLWGLWHGSAAGLSSLGVALAGLSPAGRLTWIAFRVVAAVITVPIAEELAFRGFLARRMVAAEFERVPFSGLTAMAIGVSSVAFGLMHGASWVVGILAGLAYAGVAKWRGRLGDAVVAHATTNLLLAVWVLARGDWAQW